MPIRLLQAGRGGRFVSRRDALARIVASGAALLAGLGPGEGRGQASADGALSSCVARPEQTEGPFFVDKALNRSDIRSDPRTGDVKAGVPLRIMFLVSRLSAGSCAPLKGARIDVWQSDASGRYSDVRGFGSSSTGAQFLRGFQLTDAAGSAQFLTIFPGWYGGRAVHLHFKIRTAAATAANAYTSQLYFEDALTERVFAMEPYASRGRRWMRNGDDAIFRDGGQELLLAAKPEGEGYTGLFDVGLAV